MFKIELELADKVMLRTVDGKAVYWDVAATPASVLAQVLVGGAKVMLTNAFNGARVDANTPSKDTPEPIKLAAMLKRMDAWYKGEYVVVERDSQYGAMREAFVDERRAALNCTQAEVEKAIKDEVAKVYGKDEKATFGRFLDALAEQIGKRDGLPAADVKAKLEAKYAGLADEAAKKRAKVIDKLDLSSITF